MTIILDQFCFRHWDNPNYHGARITTMTKDEFIEHVRKYIQENGGFEKCSVEGYAPFCRHIFIDNPADACVDCVKITKEIEPLIKSGYCARSDKELPVLCRWVRAEDLPGGKVPKAPVLDLIFYSHEQLVLEAEAMNSETEPGDWDWGLISIKGQHAPGETPMQPITAMRNALGREYGGSSVPIDEKKYRESAEYWNNYVSVQ